MIPNVVFQSIVGISRDAVLLFSCDRQLLYANSFAIELFNLPEDLSNQQSAESLPKEVVGVLDCAESQILEYKTQGTNGSPIWLDATANNVAHNGLTYELITCRDITYLKQKESKLKKEARTDFLSGLSNRREFQKLLDANKQNDICIAVVDVDHFKQINDQYGHLLGDSAIRFVAEKMLNSFAGEICVARLGGEEFAVLMRSNSQSAIVELFDVFRKSIADCSFSSQQINLTVSIGLAFSSSDCTGGHDLLDRADKAVYQSKDSGRNRVTVFSE